MLSREEERIARIPRSIGLVLLLRFLIYADLAWCGDHSCVFRILVAADLVAGLLLFLGRSRAAALPVLVGFLASGAGLLPGILLQDSSWRVAVEGLATLIATAAYFQALRLMARFAAREQKLVQQPALTPRDDGEGTAD
ncbi:MAG: hypothetical protein RL095_2667 [Verrucomicrobiota bacterium]|jgi:hypothetical protein